MSQLPYSQPDRDINLNLAMAVLILNKVALTDRGKALINFERLQLFIFLIKNPTFLVSVGRSLGHASIVLDESESYSVASITYDIEGLFNPLQVKAILKLMAAKGLLKVSYRKADGFMLELSDEGTARAGALTGEYFDRIRQYVELLKKFNAEPTRNILRLTQQSMSVQNEQTHNIYSAANSRWLA